MANKVKIDYSQFKASGVYTLEFDASQSVILTSQTIRLVVGFSNKGPFNTPVYIPDPTTMISVFGDIDRSLENKGSFFHRSILTCLNTGPVFGLNLLKLNDDADTGSADEVTYRAYSLDTEQYNGVVTSELYSSYYNKERFWYADTKYFLATLSTPDTGKLFALTNLGKTPISVITRKSTDSSKPLKGYDIFALDWYGANNVPTFMHPYDYMSDYFIDVIAVSGDWTNYAALALDPKWSSYFTNNGFIKSQIDSFLSQQDVNIVTSVTGCIIPDFVDLNGVNQYIQTLVNSNSPATGLFCAIDEQAFDNICTNPYQIDLVGNHLIDELSGNRDLANPAINFLSYDQALVADYLYTQNVIGVTGATGFVGPTGATGYTSGMNTGTLFTLTGSGITAGVVYQAFAAYDANAYDGGLHYLQTSGTTGASGYFQTAAQKNELKTFLTVNSSNDQKYIIGIVEGISGATGALINQFSLHDLVKLKVTGTKDVSGELRIFFSHPLDTAYYRSQGITVAPVYSLTSYNTGASGSNPNFYPSAYQFGNSDYLDRVANVPTPNGVTGPNAANGTSTVLQAYNASSLFQNVKYTEITDGDIIWLNSAGTSVNYLTFESTVDRDQFNYVNTRSHTNVSLAPNTINSIAYFGDGGAPVTYASDNIGSPVSSQKFDIISQDGSINEFIDCTRIDTTSFYITEDANGNVPVSVGDLVVCTDLDICVPATGNQQSRLAKITTVASTTTSGTYKAICARPVLYYSGDGNMSRVQKFSSIAQFTRSFDFTYLSGFTMKESHRPNGSDARVSTILDVMYDTNIAQTLASKDVISFRYVVDTFSGQILPNSKYQLSRLAMIRQQSLALINAPSMEQFQKSTDPRFTNAPTAPNPYPSLNTAYIADGGNLSLNPSYTFSLPSEAEGSKFAAFYAPYITIRESNRNINVPPAAMVSNNFVRKFATGEPYAIIAGQKRGILSGGGNIVGVEYDFTDEDRGNLEPFGINPIIKRRGIGVVIFGNQTAYQQVNSAFNLVHVRDLLISIETDVQSILSNYLFDFNDDSIRLEIKTLVDNYLDGVRAGGGIYNYQTVMDASNNTPAIIDMNMGIIDVIIEPARGIQKFINRITVTRTGGIAAGGFIQFV